MKTVGEKVHQELEKRKDSTSGGEKRKKGASEEPKTGELVHQKGLRKWKNYHDQLKSPFINLHRQYNCFWDQIFMQLFYMAHMPGEITITTLTLIL